MQHDIQDIRDNPESSFRVDNLPKIINEVATGLDGKVEARAEAQAGTYQHPGFAFIEEPGQAEKLVVRFYRVREDRKDESLGYIEENGWAKGWVLERYLQFQQVAA